MDIYSYKWLWLRNMQLTNYVPKKWNVVITNAHVSKQNRESLSLDYA